MRKIVVATDFSFAAHRARDVAIELASKMGAGPPWEVVARPTTEIDADLAVVGTHGRRGLARAFHGKRRREGLRTSPRPVLMARG
jgi:hypothetical protein